VIPDNRLPLPKRLYRDKLPADTVTAIHECIDRWFDLLEHKNNVPDCQLCELFSGAGRVSDGSRTRCAREDTGERCPIIIANKGLACGKDSLYEEWSDTRTRSEEEDRAARNMIEFLINLLPKNQRHHYYD